MGNNTLLGPVFFRNNVNGEDYLNMINNHVVAGLEPQQYSTNENPSLSRNNFLANLMHGHSDSSWSEVAFRKLPSKEFFMCYFISSKSD